MRSTEGANTMMWLRLAGTGLLSLVLVVPAPAQNDRKKDDKSTAEPLEAEKVLQPGKFSGKVAQVSETSLQLRLDYVHYELNPKAAKANRGDRQLQQLLRQQSQLAQARDRYLRARTPQEQYRALLEVQRH